MCTRDLGLIVTIVSSIVGVSVLALPFCFQQCGIVLGPLLLICCSWFTYKSSLMLIQLTTVTQRRTYVGLAQMSHGKTGKLVVELSVIGLMLGTSVAFFVVMNELGANLLQAVSGSKAVPWQQATLLVTITALGVLPLSLQRNLSDSLLWLLISLVFYTFFMVMLLARCLDAALSVGGLATPQIRLWRWSGVFTCLPILASMFVCQPQVLPTYFNLKERSVGQMDSAFKQAFIISCTFYTIVGLCGYIPLPQTVTGNVLATLPSTVAVDSIRLMFLFSLVMGFPLVVLPCRQAINTLLFERQREDGTFSVSGDMPTQRHVMVTVSVVFSTMIVGALVLDVETVLGVIGTTAGSMISFICPSIIHAKLRRDTSVGRVILGVGIFLLLIHASSVTDILGDEIHLEPIRKFRASGVLTFNDTRQGDGGRALPVSVSDGGGPQTRSNRATLAYGQGETKEPSYAVTGERGAAMRREAGFVTLPSKPSSASAGGRTTATTIDRGLEGERRDARTRSKGGT